MLRSGPVVEKNDTATSVLQCLLYKSVLQKRCWPLWCESSKKKCLNYGKSRGKACRKPVLQKLVGKKCGSHRAGRFGRRRKYFKRCLKNFGERWKPYILEGD